MTRIANDEPIGRGVGELIVAVLAQMADMERQRIKERCDAGRVAARSSLETTGKTHRGKLSLGRPKVADATEVVAWRKNASLTRWQQHVSTETAWDRRKANAAGKLQFCCPLRSTGGTGNGLSRGT